jgi:hypothetical protein
VTLPARRFCCIASKGLGDTVQFIRYVPMVAGRGAKVVVEAPASLHPLLSALGGIDQLVDKGETLPSFDLHCPLMSLPLAFRTTLETIPGLIPYLTVSSDLVERWSERLGTTSNPRVALAWRGNPNNTEDHNRSTRFVDIKTYLSPGFDWLCLHHDLTDAEREHAGSLDHLMTPLDGDTSLEDAVALCALADLVVTVDTSFAHIAGALGKTSLVMLRFTPDHRWMLGRHDSPWYNTMTLFRQDETRDWGKVMQDVVADLHHRFGV